MYICQSQSPSSCVCSLRLCLYFCFVNKIVYTNFFRFHIYALIYDICFSLSDFTLYDSYWKFKMRKRWNAFKIAFEQHLTIVGNGTRAVKDFTLLYLLLWPKIHSKTLLEKKHPLVQYTSIDYSISRVSLKLLFLQICTVYWKASKRVDLKWSHTHTHTQKHTQNGNYLSWGMSELTVL